MKTICEDPRIIVHPNVAYHAERAVYKIINGKCFPMHYNETGALFNGSFFIWLYSNFPKVNDLKTSDIDNYYFVDENGEILPVYLEVPCGSCDVCRMRKINSVVQQCEFELLDDNYPLCDNFFVTLTYRQLPWCSSFLGGLCVRHVQAYIKRVRSWISKNVGSEDAQNIKVIYSGEYGSKTGRPHYHIAFFHFPIHKIQYPIQQALKLFEYLWSKPKFGFMLNFVPFSEYKVRRNGSLYENAQLHYDTFNYGIVKVKRIYSNNVGKYIGKYIAKGGKILNISAPFFRKSINLGMKYFDANIRQQLYDNKVNKFTYKNLSNKIKEDSHICSYYLNKLYPSVTRFVSSDIRRCLFYMRLVLAKLKRDNFVDVLPYSINSEDIHYIKSLYFQTDNTYKSIFKKCLRYINSRFSNWKKDIQDIVDYNNERAIFMANSSKEQSPFDEVFRLKWSYNDIKLQIKL